MVELVEAACIDVLRLSPEVDSEDWNVPQIEGSNDIMVNVTMTTGAVPVGAVVGTAEGVAEGETTGDFVGDEVSDADACTPLTTT